MSNPFIVGDLCHLIDSKGRRYLVDLAEGAHFQYHVGKVAHDDILGGEDGIVVTSSRGGKITAVRPGLAEYVLTMPRGAQVVYPKDWGPILVWGDIGPGMTVVEAGTGSGALTMALVRAVGPTGKVISFDRRDDHHLHATKTIERFFGAVPENCELHIGDIAEELGSLSADRVVLDLPEPWEVAVPAADALMPGGRIIIYLPSIGQVQRAHYSLHEAGRFDDPATFEVLHREWVVDGRAVRPSGQMVGHTGFITTARRVVPRPG
ncbi:tRNA (adenine-N1)-methyltransferase [bacterium]|nr:tRNA (adenine-N1)-methyltransferase [bacterium]